MGTSKEELESRIRDEAAPAPVDPFTEPGAIVHEEPDVLTVSTSEARTLSTCKRRYYFEYKLGRRPRDQGHGAVWGAALHRGLEVWFQWMSSAAPGDATEARQIAALSHAIAAALSPGVDSEGRAYEPPADPYARAALSAILRAYVEYWWTDETTYEVVAVELPFKLPVKTRLGRLIKGKLCYACGGSGKLRTEQACPDCSGVGRLRPQREGRIDLVVRARRQVAENITEPDPTPGALWLVEHKSTSWEPGDERYYAGIEVDLQTALYFDAAREMGLSPVGVMYDVIRSPAYDEPKPAPALKKDGTPRAQRAEVSYSNPRFGESPADYEERIYRLATGEETRSHWFGRRELPISEKQIRASRETMHSAVDEIRWREKTGHWPMTGDRYTCASAKKVCPWLDVCGGRVEVGSEEFERLYPLKIKREGV